MIVFAKPLRMTQVKQHDRYVLNEIMERWHHEQRTYEEPPQTFKLIDNMDEIRIVAASLVNKWNHIFEIDELINEAWMRLGDEEFETLNRLKTAVHCDMIDYIRSIVGRKSNGRKNKDGSIMKDVRLGTARLCSNTIDSEDAEGKKWNPFEQQITDIRFKQIDDQDFIDSIIKKVDMSEKEKDIFIRRFQHSMYPAQIKEETGVKTITVNYYVRKSLNKFLAINSNLDKEWVLKHKERLMLT